jgi:hypothetical protein
MLYAPLLCPKTRLKAYSCDPRSGLRQHPPFREQVQVKVERRPDSQTMPSTIHTCTHWSSLQAPHGQVTGRTDSGEGNRGASLDSQRVVHGRQATHRFDERDKWAGELRCPAARKHPQNKSGRRRSRSCAENLARICLLASHQDEWRSLFIRLFRRGLSWSLIAVNFNPNPQPGSTRLTTASALICPS